MIADVTLIVFVLVAWVMFMLVVLSVSGWLWDRTVNVWIWRRYGKHHGFNDAEVAVLQRSTRGWWNMDTDALDEAFDMREKREATAES